MGAFIYRANVLLRNFSDALVGNYFEASKDVIVITGGCSGLGKELVLKFASSNGKVAVLDLVVPIDEEKVKGVRYFECDVGDRNQVFEAHKDIVAQLGTPTILINNAAITKGKTLLDLTYDEVEQIIQTNLLASFYTIKAFLPDMIAMKRGYIITIASVLGYMSPARLSAYGASKSGLIALHESLTYELGLPIWNHSGVKTLLVCPGQLRTKMFSGVKTPFALLAPELNPVNVANSVFSAIAIGRKGEIKLPFYGNFIPVFRAVPWPLVQMVRSFSGIDDSMKSFKDMVSEVASRTSSIAPRSQMHSAVDQ